MKFGKRQLVLASLVLALGAAVYLNWQFSSTDSLTAPKVETSSKELGQAEFVNSSTDSSAEDTSDDNKENEESSVETSKETSEYFSSATIERQKTQDKIIDDAKEILEAVSSDDKLKEEALEDAALLAKIVAQQTNIESLIKAKGINECLAFIQNGECSIVVSKGQLSDENIIMIKDIVEGQAGIDFEKIKITEV